MSQSDFVTRGQALVAAGQYQEAVKVCRLGLLGRPTTVEGRVVLGQALLALKRYDEVLAEMRVALELDHTSLPAQLLKGEALLRKGDGDAAVDVLSRAKAQAPNEPRIAQLLAEAERATGRPPGSAGHPAVNFFAGEVPTKHYPNHSGVGDEESGPSGSYTRPTSLSAPGSKKRSAPRQAAQPPEGTPSPAMLAVGDRSGTVEVDPDAEGVEVDDEELGDLAAPPPSGRRPAVDEDGLEIPTAWAGGNRTSEPRGSVKPRSYAPPSNGESPFEVPTSRRAKPMKEVSSVELLPDDLEQLDDDDDEVFETKSRQNREMGPRSAVRAAVQVAPGPLHDPATSGRMPANRPTAIGQAQAPLAQLLASQPRDQQQVGPSVPPTPSPLPPPPQSASHHSARPNHGEEYTMRGPHGTGNAPLPRPYPSAPLAAAMPTMAAQPSSTFRAPAGPPMPAGVAHAPTLALQPAGDPNLFGHDGTPPVWSRPTVAAPAAPPPPQRGYGEDPRRPAPMDPGLAALAANPADYSGVASVVEPSASGKSPKTGVRKSRSRLTIVVWIVIGTLVIGGGVFAGFQIRNMRLNRQITDARERATERAKADTFQGWITARESLSNIVQASATTDNRAALARAKALMAYEFGYELGDAKAAVEALAGDGGLDADIADAYIALAQNDGKTARAAADRALATSSTDPAALYVSGQAYLLAGDVKQAVTAFKAAFEGEQRALYAIGHARALAATGQLEEALAAIDRALASSADNPAAAIVRAKLLVEAGRIVPNAQIANEVHTQLDRLIAEGAKPPTEQTHGVSPPQLAFMNLALARVDFALTGLAKAINDVNAAAKIGYDDQRFAEDAVDTLYRIGHLKAAVNVAHDGIERYPNSRLLRISLAQILTAQGKAGEALELLGKSDAKELALGLAVRGDAKAASGDIEGARSDYDAALKKLPELEVALVGKAWLDLAANQVDDARKLIEKKIKQTGNTVPMTTVYAAILRATGDAKARDDARKLLEKVAAGGQGVDAARAQLELARLYRDSNDFRNARAAYAEATKAGSVEARVEVAQVQIEDKDPLGAKETLEVLLKDLGDRASANVVLEAARARMLAGDNAGGEALLQTAAKAPNVVKWQLDRETGRLALRRGDYARAAQTLTRALDTSGDDAETLLLAGDAVDGDASLTALAAKVKALAPTRLKGKAELQIVNGLLALAQDTPAGNDAAGTAYNEAKKTLETEKASNRRLARANFGLALVAIAKNDPSAKDFLQLATERDPSLYDAYLYAADNAYSRTQYKDALQLAQKATTFNPDSVAAWHRVGLYAARANDQKTLAEAITQLNKLAPNTDELKELLAKKR